MKSFADGHFVIVNDSQGHQWLDGQKYYIIPTDEPMTFPTLEAAAGSLVSTAAGNREDPFDPNYLGIYMLIRLTEEQRKHAVNKTMTEWRTENE